MHSFILTKYLTKEPYSGIIGYPRTTQRQIARRIVELEKLDVQSVSFTGTTSIGKLEILGKGYAGVVVLAKRGTNKVALKIRRIDSQRSSMRKEERMLRAANSIGVGPRLYDASKNYLIMEYIEGRKISDWIRTVGGKGSASIVKKTIREILESCYKMDIAGIDHGELSSISKHVIIGKTRQTIIDFESSSMLRKAANVTSATQAIFIGSGISKKVSRIYRVPPKQEIIDSLRQYKKDKSRQNFQSLLQMLRL